MALTPEQKEEIKKKYFSASQDFDEDAVRNVIRERMATVSPVEKPKVGLGQKILNAGTKVANFFGAKGISEQFGADIARAKAPEAEKDFVEYPKMKEVVGSAIQTGANFLPGAGVGAKLGTKVAVGAGTGYAFDVGSGLQGGEAIKDSFKPGMGTVLGGAIGGAAGVVSNRIASRAERLAAKSKNYALDLVSPKATSKVSEQAIMQGRVSEPGLFKKAQITPSQRDMDLAKSVERFVSPKKTVLQNTDAIDKGIREINRGVKEYVTQNKVPFNMNQLKSQLNAGKEELKLVFASDKTAEKTYNAVVDEFMKHIEKGDTAGLFQARQSVDRIPAIKKLLDSQGLGENVKKEVVLTVRRMANRYISDLLPKGNPYKTALLNESRMIEALGNIAEKNRGMIGKNNLQILAQRYPLLKFAIGAAGAGIVGAAGLGLGGAIIGSTD